MVAIQNIASDVLTTAKSSKQIGVIEANPFFRTQGFIHVKVLIYRVKLIIIFNVLDDPSIEYAVFWVKQSIMFYIKDNMRIVKTPACVFSDLNRVSKVKQLYYAEHLKYPTDTEIATLTGLSISRVKYLKDMDFDIVSTEEQPNESMPGTVQGIISSIDAEVQNKGLYLEDCKEQIRRFLLKLPERERLVIEMRFGLNTDDAEQIKSLSEIGVILGLSKERVRQIEERALLRLRKMPNIATLYDYLDI